MILADYFSNDDNEHVKSIQHKYYGDAWGVIFKWARCQYISSIRNLDLATTIQSKVSCLDGFDHRTLQMFHDFLAASFRHYLSNELETYLPFPGEDEEKRIVSLWSSYIEHELERIKTNHAGIVRNIIEAVCYPNPNPIGIKAEDRLTHSLLNDERYLFLDSRYKAF